MGTKLALIIDECVAEMLAAEIESCTGGLSSCERIDSSHELCARSDKDIMAYATQQNKIFVTVENRIDEKNFKICTHPGIIVIHSASCHGFSKSKLFSKFMQSGERKKAQHAVTHLRSRFSYIKAWEKDGGPVVTITLNL